MQSSTFRDNVAVPTPNPTPCPIMNPVQRGTTRPLIPLSMPGSVRNAHT